MRVQALAWRRSRAQAGLLASNFAAIATLAALLAGTIGYLDFAGVAGVRTALAAAGGAGGAVQIAARLSDDPAAQDAEAEQALNGAFAGFQLGWTRSLQTSPQAAAVEGATGEQFSLVLGSDPNAESRVRLVRGNWPTDAGAGALQADAAEALGVGVGDVLRVGETGVGDTGASDSAEGAGTNGAGAGATDLTALITITATWRAIDAADPVWLGDPLVAVGSSDDAYGPLLTSEQTMATVAATPFARWTVVPDAATVGPDDLTAIVAGVPAVIAELDDSTVFNTSGVVTSGGLVGTASEMRLALAAIGGIAPVPVTLLILLGLIALTQLARLLRSVRASETALARARGASLRQLLALDASEAALVAVPAAIVGGALACLALLLAFGGAAGVVSAFVAVILVTAAVAVVAVIIACATAVGAARAAGGRGEDSGRTSRTLTVGATVLAVIAAGITLWQFRLYGGPLSADANGILGVDPLAVLAPAITLVALCLLGLLAFAPLAVACERLAARARGIVPVLPARQVARRLSVFAVAVVLIGLAAGGTSFAAAYGGTWAALGRSTAELRTGSAVRVITSGNSLVRGPATLVTASAATTIDDALAAAPVLSAPIKLGQEPAVFTAIAAEALTTVAASVDQRVDTAALAALLTAAPAGTPIAEGARTLTVTASVQAPPRFDRGTVAVSALLCDRLGATVRVPFGEIALASSPEPSELSAELPPGRAPWSLLGIDVELVGSGGAEGIGVLIDSVRSDADAQPLQLPSDPDPVSLSSKEPTHRILAMAAEPRELPLVLTEALAGRIGAKLGDTFDFAFVGTGRSGTGVVVGFTPLVPGTTSANGVLADLGSYSATSARSSYDVGRASQLWIASDHPAATASAALLAFGGGATVSSTASSGATAILRPAVTALWMGAVGGVALAVLALFAISVALARSRRGEVTVLRAIGMTAREQARGRSAELAGVSLLALAFGVLAGLGSALLTAGELARVAVGPIAGLNARILVDGVPFAAALAALLAGIALVVSASARRIRRQALDTESREETR